MARFAVFLLDPIRSNLLIQVSTATLCLSLGRVQTHAMQALATRPALPAFVLPEPVAAFARFCRVQTIAIRTGNAFRERSRL